ncbi:hypothetical protein [Metabacillus endolithicus]|uniref:hypothetical protein n=1 Tax=Metabacillus endolithicus TaxID=1535204 RepID=UPI001FF81BEE|nr:hypothetical protein [Metabacillus endolithicus]UPG65525.1 hypothetical protein MVE64_11450 [Metabacillus endolithicus]
MKIILVFTFVVLIALTGCSDKEQATKPITETEMKETGGFVLDNEVETTDYYSSIPLTEEGAY